MAINTRVVRAGGVLTGVLLGMVVCAGCSRTPAGQTGAAQEPVAAAQEQASETTGAERVTTCPSLDFHQFIAAFAESAAVQRAFTIIPIKYRQKNSDELAEYKGELQFPLFPASEKRAAWKMDFSVTELSNTRATVSLKTAGAPNEGLTVQYHFRKDACWQLEYYEQTIVQKSTP